ncbi:unnamed protein product [Xylocopa violacea]|uniref:Uncharacterized protein n=1 Tax=Xylocopa violacea TaxID=135666 RepID=A0ABP1N9E2_XYLVO
MKSYQLLSLMFISYYIAVYNKCSVSCATSSKLQSLTSIKHPNVYNGHKDSNYLIRSQRQLKETDYNIDSKEEKQIRDSRRVTGSRRHLRVGDAHQVANYFLSGGPLKGHDHFVQGRDCDSRNDGDTVAEASNVTTENNTDLSANEENSNTNLSDSIVGAPHIPSSGSQLGAAPIGQSLYNSGTDNLNSMLHPVLNTLTGTQNSLGHDLLRSVLHPNLHPHINTLHHIPRTLIRTATLPVTSLMQARSELRNILHPNGPLLRNVNKSLLRAKARKNHLIPPIYPLHPIHPLHRIHPLQPVQPLYPIGHHPPIVGLAHTGLHSNALPPSTIQSHQLIPHPEPTGYIVRYVPHNKSTTSLSPVVGASHQQSASCVDNNLNMQQNVANPTNNENENTNETTPSIDEDQTEDDNQS